jgi:hypothetical protein
MDWWRVVFDLVVLACSLGCFAISERLEDER